MSIKMFVNFPVKDLQRSIAFYEALGFSFNPQFTDETAAGMVISEHNYAMLLTYEKWRTFTAKPIADAHAVSCVAVALALESPQAVDEIIEKALAAGGREPNPKQDHGFMIQRSFEDPDGHTWEPFWMDPKYIQS